MQPRFFVSQPTFNGILAVLILLFFSTGIPIAIAVINRKESYSLTLIGIASAIALTIAVAIFCVLICVTPNKQSLLVKAQTID